MKNTFAVSAAIAACLVSLVGCSSQPGSKNAPSLGQSGQAQNGQDWTLSFSANCETSADAAADANCFGLHGFKISSDKTFQIGPSSTGQTKSGDLSEAEFNSFYIYLVQLLGSSFSPSFDSSEKCDALEDASREERLSLTLSGRGFELASASDGQFCSRSANFDAVKQLHLAVKQLAGKYYTLPFPDNCNEAVAGINQLITDSQKCAKDSDCFYVSSGDFIPPGVSEFMITDNCTVLPQLVVASAVTYTGNRARILTATSDAEKACAKFLVRENCTEFTGFDSSLGAPVCQQGLCRVTPKFNPPPGY